MINNSMHLMYKKRSTDNSLKAQGNQGSNTEFDGMLNNTGQGMFVISMLSHH